MTLNERIAKVKGWDYDEECEVAYVRVEGGKLRSRDWSGNIADAWELVEEMQEAGWHVEIDINSKEEPIFVDVVHNQEDMVEEGSAPTAPEAICLAWLAIHEK